VNLSKKTINSNPLTMKKNLLFTTIGFLFVCSLLNAQVALPYFSGFDNAAQKAGWTEYKKASTQYSHWNYGGGAFSPATCVGHDYSPSTGISLTDNWFVSPPFVITNGGILDSIRYKCSGFSVPVTGDTVALYILNGSQDPALATSKILLFDFRGADYVNDYTYKLKTALPLTAAPGNSYLAIRYRNTDCSSKWLSVSFDNVAIRGNSSVGIEDIEEDNLVNIYPNPSNGTYIVSGNDIIQIEVYDVSGKLILSLKDSGNLITQEIDLSGTKGVYFVKVMTKEKVISKKIIVQ
jgi:hypothetical protein